MLAVMLVAPGILTADVQHMMLVHRAVAATDMVSRCWGQIKGLHCVLC
jgi:hypothetical protein